LLRKNKIKRKKRTKLGVMCKLESRLSHSFAWGIL
jgi:hypothetical protein